MKADFFHDIYLPAHRKPLTRYLHFAGSIAALGLIVAAIGGPWWLALLAPVAGYGFAWTAHFFIEHNHPATFRYPLPSLACDLLMLSLWLSGMLEAEL